MFIDEIWTVLSHGASCLGYGALDIVQHRALRYHVRDFFVCLNILKVLPL
jgi:hypothetical protein